MMKPNMDPPVEKKEEKKAVSDAGAWAMNVISSVGIIMANKQVMSAGGYDFRFATTLTAFHFAVTAGVGYLSSALGYSVSKHVPFKDLFLFSLVSNTSIVSMNLSLMLNSVGFYQIAKLSMIPTVSVLEWLIHNKNYTREVKLSIFVVMIGVGVCTVTDVNVNLKGFMAAVVAVMSTSLQQIYIGALQKKHNCSSFELLSKTAPIQAASLIVIGPYMDYFLNGRNILNYNFTMGAVLFIMLSCVLAVFCNISQYLCIGRFSAVTFQVLGHMKTVCVLILGWLLFDSILTGKNLMGMFMAIVGMVTYSWAVEVAKAQAAKAAAVRIMEPNLQEEDSLLKGDLEFGRVEKS
jgi:solute carrier family 35 protein E3